MHCIAMHLFRVQVDGKAEKGGVHGVGKDAREKVKNIGGQEGEEERRGPSILAF